MAEKKNTYQVSDTSAGFIAALKQLNQAKEAFHNAVNALYGENTQKAEDDRSTGNFVFGKVEDFIYSRLRDSISANLDNTDTTEI